MKKRFDWQFYLLLLIVLILSYDAIALYKIRQDRKPIAPPFALPTAIMPVNTSELYEFCVLREDNRDSDKKYAGTQIPFQPVAIATAPTAQASVEPILQPAITEAASIREVPTKTPSKEMPFSLPNIEVVKIGNFKPTNYHFVLVGSGYDSRENREKLDNLIAGFQKKFSGINVDFAYIKEPVNIRFKRIDTIVLFENDNDRKILVKKIKSMYPMDSLIVALNAPEIVGSAILGMPEGNFAILASNTQEAPFIFTHEMGHLLGIENDGYNRYFKPEDLPNTELFYIDSMPKKLARALEELGETPPMYIAGTCNGRMLYTFYNSLENVYGNVPVGGLPAEYLNSLEFTPLQILEMNDYISSH